MASPCYYHPDTAASTICVQCGLPICANCTDRVGEKTVCHKCVKAVRTRLEAQMAAVPASAYGGPAPAASYGAPQGQYGGPIPGRGQQTYGGNVVAAAEPLDASKVILGIVAALVVGIIGAIIVEKILFLTGGGLSLLYIAIGYGVGFALHKVVGRGGTGLAALATGIMFISLLVGQLVYTSDWLGRHIANSPEDAGATFADAFPFVLSHMSPMHWVCLVIGLFACFRGVNSQE